MDGDELLLLQVLQGVQQEALRLSVQGGGLRLSIGCFTDPLCGAQKGVEVELSIARVSQAVDDGANVFPSPRRHRQPSEQEEGGLVQRVQQMSSPHGAEGEDELRPRGPPRRECEEVKEGRGAPAGLHQQAEAADVVEQPLLVPVRDRGGGSGRRCGELLVPPPPLVHLLQQAHGCVRLARLVGRVQGCVEHPQLLAGQVSGQ